MQTNNLRRFEVFCSTERDERGEKNEIVKRLARGAITKLLFFLERRRETQSLIELRKALDAE